MTEPTTATNVTASDPTPDRPALYKVSAGRVLKGATVQILGMDEQIPAKASAWVEEVGVPTPRQATVRYTHLARHFRTSEERNLGRDFTAEEAAASDRRLAARIATYSEQHLRETIDQTLADIALRLEHAAEELRREVASAHADPARKVERAQNTLAWLVPNLGVHNLTHDAISWSLAARDLERLGAAALDPTPTA